MSTYAFIELPAPLNEWCGQSDALFPVDSTHVAEIQAADPPEPERILFELEAYLEEYPGKAARFAETGGELARIFHRKEVGGTAGRRVNSGV